jgi:4-hydroxyphenylpyruvate dioxygenase-like putative hemolysin
MSEAIKKRSVRIVLIPESLYEKLEKRAKEEDASVSGMTCRAIIDYLDKTPKKND